MEINSALRRGQFTSYLESEDKLDAATKRVLDLKQRSVKLEEENLQANSNLDIEKNKTMRFNKIIALSTGVSMGSTALLTCSIRLFSPVNQCIISLGIAIISSVATYWFFNRKYN